MGEEFEDNDPDWVPRTPAKRTGFVSNAVASYSTRIASNSHERKATKVGCESLGLRGKSKSENGGMSDTPKKRRTDGVDKKPHTRMRMKNRPKVVDRSKTIKPATPKLRTPKPARYVKKEVDCSKKDDKESMHGRGKGSCKRKLDFSKESCIVEQKNLKFDDGIKKVDRSKNDNREAICGHGKRSCKSKLDSIRESCIVEQKNLNLKPHDGINNISEMKRKLRSHSRLAPPLQVYRRRDRRKSCIEEQKNLNLKPDGGINNISEMKRQLRSNSRLAPPLQVYRRRERRKISKKRRMMRQRVSHDKLIELIRMIKMIHDKFLRECVFNLNLTWINLKKKRSKTPTRRRVLSSSFATREEVQHEGARDDLVSYNGDISCVEVQDVAVKRLVEHQDDSNIHVEGQDEGVQNVIVKKRVEHQAYNGSSAGAMEVQDEGLQNMAVKESVEYQDIIFSYYRNIQNCSAALADCTSGADTKIPKHSLELNTSFQQEEEEEQDMMCKWLDLSNEQKNILSMKEALVDFATQKMESLCIDDGSIVPSKENMDPSKNFKPKVDLDLETMRFWNLIENNVDEATEEKDGEKANSLKEERELYRGRVDSFIARMHTIQGNRRFSKWKGSVVDSIVGVFLTQNVCDHLSSCAFMSLVAKYPPLSVAEQNEILETQQLKLAELPSGKSEESNRSSQVEVDFENEDKTCSGTEAGRRDDHAKDQQEKPINWDDLRKYSCYGVSRNRTELNADSVDWEAIRQASVGELARAIAERGMNNLLAQRIKNFLDRLVRDHGRIDLEWLRDVPPDKAKEYLKSIDGIGLKSVECVRLLSLFQKAFPIDTNAARCFVRLGWVELEQLPEGVHLHQLNEYPMLDHVQKYMWPRICDRDELTLYEFHCHTIAFCKAFCTKTQPNCNACPMRGECKHYASALASSRLHLEGSREKNMASESSTLSSQEAMVNGSPPKITNSSSDASEEDWYSSQNSSDPTVEFPASPEPVPTEPLGGDIEDFGCDSEIPTIILNSKELSENPPSFVDDDDDISKALVALTPQVASIPMPKLKHVERLRTVHQVYEIPDSHPLLAGFEKREDEDPCPYLLAIWTTDETTESSQESKKWCNCEDSNTCDARTCCLGEIVQYQKEQSVQGTILIPCRTANRGRFPLNGTYFQVNEVFADHESSRRPIDVPRQWIWNLRRPALYCGTSTAHICRGMSLEEILICFREGFICTRGFDVKTRRARMLTKRFHVCKTRQPDDE